LKSEEMFGSRGHYLPPSDHDPIVLTILYLGISQCVSFNTCHCLYIFTVNGAGKQAMKGNNKPTRAPNFDYNLSIIPHLGSIFVICYSSLRMTNCKKKHAQLLN